MTNSVTLKGSPVEIGGKFPQKGQTAPDFSLADKARADVTLANFAGKRKVLNIFPSIDTPTCATSVRTFNQQASKLNNTVVLCIQQIYHLHKTVFALQKALKTWRHFPVSVIQPLLLKVTV